MLSQEEQFPDTAIDEGKTEQQVKRVSKKPKQAIESLAEIQQRAMMAYAAYMDAERQVRDACEGL